MRKFLTFLAGFISGVVAVFLFALIFANKLAETHNIIDGLTLFEQAGEVMSSPSYQVFQVVDGGNALAHVQSNSKLENTLEEIGFDLGLDFDMDYYNGIVVLFMADENYHFYDEQIIKVPNDKCVRQVGIYQYPTENGYKTVPAVAFCDL